MKSIEQSIQLMMNSDAGQYIKLQGCSEDELAELARAQHVAKLPETYVEFMRRVGKTKDFVSIGSDWAYPEVCTLKTSMIQILNEEWPDYEIDESIYVFHSHQGYQFAFFFGKDLSDNPPVYYYRFDQKSIELIYQSFLEWLETTLSGRISGVI
ncbi:SMI1/KNR4 family protein [Deinococcus navajonensis]|uniref:SMI1/KNR4 family protein n=1 Tax=Deinococcus navajonensis TaxID=309884 RepID=A0ABV8XH00_9DEIO